ncbi:10225_t:CDS:2, partial [Paraglomus occultum]
MTEGDYRTLTNVLKKQSHILIEVFPEDFGNMPNLHLNVHLPKHAKKFATLVNTSVGVKEMVHRIFKGVVRHKNVEMDLVKKWIAKVPSKELLHKLLSNWYATEEPLSEENNTDAE